MDTEPQKQFVCLVILDGWGMAQPSKGNAISQAKLFKEVIDVTGLFLAKVDGTAKGGIVIGMQDEVKIPVKFLGLGEGADDIQKFDPDRFVDALFD